MDASSTPTLTLAHVLGAAGLAPAEVLLIRHPVHHPAVRLAMTEGSLRTYTADQGPKFPQSQRLWLSFLGEEGTSARLSACYANGGRPEGGAFLLTDSDVLADLRDRLVIDWGKGTRSWWQVGANASKKPVLAIAEAAVEPWPGFERLTLTFGQLSEVMAQPRRYASWWSALGSVSGVYLIVDDRTGQQYVGSAYGAGGLLGRWTNYVKTGHGGNLQLKQLLAASPGAEQGFRFSVLQILSASAPAHEVIAYESLLKGKLGSRAFGLNAN